MNNIKLGRQKRGYNPAIPHLSAILAGKGNLLNLPVSVDNTAGLPQSFGMMLNDSLSCCTCSAFYHCRQVLSAIGREQEYTGTDAMVLQMYEEACGYSPNDPNTDQGGVEQDVLTYLLNTGAPVWGPPTRDKLIAFFEVDPRNHNDVIRTIYEAGICYIGVNLPSNVAPSNAPSPAVWDVVNGSTIVGGHAVVLVGYNTVGPLLISWGEKYQATWAFMDAYCEEAYAIIDHSWFRNGGETFCGLTLPELEKQMSAIKYVIPGS